MASNFSGGLDTYVVLVDNEDFVLAAHANDRGDAIEAIEIKVGVDVSAVATTIDYFLKHASGAYRTHKHDGTSDDGALLDWDTCWTDAVHDHSSAAEGGQLDWDTAFSDKVHDHSAAAEGGTTLTGVTITLGANQEFNDKQALNFILENRTNDTGMTVTGQMWFRTDI